ncbi:MAG: hypothetical protein ABH864_00870 [archaeon]
MKKEPASKPSEKSEPKAMPEKNTKIEVKPVLEKKEKTNVPLSGGDSNIIPKKDPYKPSSTDEKIKALLDFDHIEELFYTLNILKDKEIKTFLEHYKKSEIPPSRDKKIDLAIRGSNTDIELKENIRDEIISHLEDEIQELKTRLSTLTKKGKDVYVEHVKLMTAPLKINVFKATAKKEDFYKIKKITSSVDEKIKPKEEELEREEKDKEVKQKEKEEKERQEKELKDKIKKGEPINTKKEVKQPLEEQSKPIQKIEEKNQEPTKEKSETEKPDVKPTPAAKPEPKPSDPTHSSRVEKKKPETNPTEKKEKENG